MYIPAQERIAYEAAEPLPDRAAAALAVAHATTLRQAMGAYHRKQHASPLPRSFATLMACVWGRREADIGAAATLLATPDRHGCTPWLWLADFYPPVMPSLPPPPPIEANADVPLPPLPVWYLVQTPDKKRALLRIVDGRVVATLHVKRDRVAPAAVPTSLSPPFPALATVHYVKVKMYIHMEGAQLAVVEVGTEVGNEVGTEVGVDGTVGTAAAGAAEGT
jgi:hypothetical protein